MTLTFTKKFNHKGVELSELDTQTIKGKRHYVTPAGKLPSITTVLSVLSKKAIHAWRARVGEEEANRISTQAARRGTNVHQMCEDYINNELKMEKFNPADKETFLSIKSVLDEHIGLVWAQEAPLYSEFLGVAGRVDCIAEWDGRLSVIDFKTSRKPKKKEWIDNYFQQATAYCIMFEERTGVPIDKIVIVVAVDNEPPQVFVEHRDNWVKDLMGTIQMYNRQGRR